MIDGNLVKEHVRVTLCLPDPSCFHFSGLKAHIRDTLLELDEVSSVEFVQTSIKRWATDCMEYQKIEFTVDNEVVARA